MQPMVSIFVLLRNCVTGGDSVLMISDLVLCRKKCYANGA